MNITNKVADEEPEFDFEIEEEAEDEQEPETEVEEEDDTPEEDRGKEPMPKEIVDELEADDLEAYDDKVKQRLKQMKKVWHDERREKEKAIREQRESITATQNLLEENRRLKSTLSQGEKDLIATYKRAAEYEHAAAKQAYKKAYEEGDTDKVLEAQEQLQSASYKIEQVKNYNPTLQEPEKPVEQRSGSEQRPQLDSKTLAWQERNTWWNTDDEMTASALGLHQKLVRERGASFAGTDEYWDAIDKTVRRRFPEYFGEKEVASGRASKPAQVVAPASRSRSPKKIVLKRSQLAVAKKLGLTPEQYARELMKMEA